MLIFASARFSHFLSRKSICGARINNRGNMLLEQKRQSLNHSNERARYARNINYLVMSLRWANRKSISSSSLPIIIQDLFIIIWTSRRASSASDIRVEENLINLHVQPSTKVAAFVRALRLGHLEVFKEKLCSQTVFQHEKFVQSFSASSKSNFKSVTPPSFSL